MCNPAASDGLASLLLEGPADAGFATISGLMPPPSSVRASLVSPDRHLEEGVFVVRVLMFRSCRIPQFESAVAQVRAGHPSAEIWTLTGAEHADAVVRAGSDHVIAHSASRLSIRHLGVRMVARLRRERFDLVVIPTMNAQIGSAANLLRLAVAIDAPQASICIGGDTLMTWPRHRFRGVALKTMCADLVLVTQMAHAAVHRRRARTRTGPTRVLHIINSLDIGGAQAQFAELLNRSPRELVIDVLVLVRDEGMLRGRLMRPGVAITFLDEIQALGSTPIDSIADLCRRREYDVVHTWLTEANILGAAAARLADVPRIVTSIRSLNAGNYPQWYKWWYHIGDILSSRSADIVTVNATPLVDDHARWAWLSRHRVHVVHNGLDPGGLHFDRAECRAELRRELGIGVDAPLVGCVGRLSPEKDQATFVRALAYLRDRGVAFHAVLVGGGPCREPLGELAGQLGIADRVTFLGNRTDARRLMAGLDVLALTSAAEGFPNVLIEAGFLGVPVVSTAAGGVIDVIGNADLLCPCGDAPAVARALQQSLGEPLRTARLADELRRRCQAMFTADHMATRWLSLYGESAALERAAA